MFEAKKKPQDRRFCEKCLGRIKQLSMRPLVCLSMISLRYIQMQRSCYLYRSFLRSTLTRTLTAPIGNPQHALLAPRPSQNPTIKPLASSKTTGSTGISSYYPSAGATDVYTSRGRHGTERNMASRLQVQRRIDGVMSMCTRSCQWSGYWSSSLRMGRRRCVGFWGGRCPRARFRDCGI